MGTIASNCTECGNDVLGENVRKNDGKCPVCGAGIVVGKGMAP